MYTDGKTVAFEDRVALHARQRFGVAPVIEGPVEVQIVAYIKPPAKPGPRHECRAGRDNIAYRRKYCTKKPDSDNIAKSVLDGCGHAFVWRDDRQVTVLQIVKLWATADEPPRTVVTIQEAP
jgi:Holliday junction resolvase RusA-like endonuclease